MAKRGHRPSQASANRPRFYGRHAVLAALDNPERTVRKIWGTHDALAGLDIPSTIPITFANAADLGRLVPMTRLPRGWSPKSTRSRKSGWATCSPKARMTTVRCWCSIR